MAFSESDPQWAAGVREASDPTRQMTAQSNDSISAFFSRPIQVATYAWTPGTAFTLLRFNPWMMFFTNPRVANRITNYNLMNCTLKVKFQINGNGFYWGRLMVDWHPYYTADSVTSTADNVFAAVGASQRLKLFIDPTNSQGGELSIPFIYHRNSMPVVDADWDLLGRVIIRQLAVLQHANSSSTPVSISVFVWAENMSLCVPTTVNAYGLTAQAGESDESTTVKLSSTIAAIAGKLETAPGIGPFAMATNMIATGVGQTARLFGFSRPAILAEPQPIRPHFFGRMATTDAADNCEKLSVTSKQEVTIDPRVCGVDTGDEMCIADIASRESFYGLLSWSTSTAVNTLIINYRVEPHDALFDSTYYYMPACAFAVRPFRFWRATMRYRFMIVASAFHKGRLRIVWDPNYIATASGPVEGNVAFSKVVDLATERDFTIDIPWGQADPFMGVPGNVQTHTNSGSSTRYTSVSTTANGVLAVYIQNQLTAVNDVPSTVSILVFKSCAELCVAAPRGDHFDEIVNAYSLTVQAGEEEMDSGAADNAPECQGPSEPLGDGNCSKVMLQVFFGEDITSFRQLLRRYQFHSGYRDLTSNALANWTIKATDFPAYKGYSANALHRTTTAKKFNYVQNTLLHYLAPAFLGCRGSMRSKYHFTSTAGETALNGMSVIRGYNLSDLGESLTPLTTTSSSTYARDCTLQRTSLYDGACVTAPEKQPIIEVEHPYYKSVRFDLTKDIDLNVSQTIVPASGLGGLAHTVNMQVSGGGTRQLYRYIAVGEDFSLFLFQGAPPVGYITDALLPAAALT